MAVLSMGLVIPGWLASFVGIQGLALPRGSGLTIVVFGVTMGGWLAVRAWQDELTPAAARGAWWVTASLPSVLALGLAWHDGPQLAEFIHDLPPLMWASTICLSVTLLSPRTSYAIGAWCGLQYAVVFGLARPYLVQVQAEPGLMEVLSGPGPAVRRIGMFLVVGLMTGLVATAFRQLVFQLLEEQSKHEADERARLLLDARRAAAESTSQAKTQFLAQLGHELLNPLNAVIGYAQLLKDSPDPAAREQASVILKNGWHLADLVADSVDSALIESGRVELVARPVHLLTFANDVVDTYALKAHSAGVELTATVSDALPRWVQADPKRLKQILTNLVSNAVKHTHEGSIQIGLGRGDSSWWFEVRDSGTGIAPSDQEAVFRPYVQSGTAEERRRGTGLGLSIAGALVEAMDGQIRLESTLGVGTSVRVTVPLVDAELQDDVIDSKSTLGLAPLVYPDSEVLDRLEDLTMQGDLGAVREAAEQLAQISHLVPFATQLRVLTQDFDDHGMMMLIAAGQRARNAD
ncbi:MAG: hypothetical protein KC912_14015 [Proteobacteria bacterium]|nr:hypothetical protein [Pseudomonadota bacterium]